MSRRSREPDLEYKVSKDGEKTRKIQKLDNSFYANLPKPWISERAKSLGMSLIDFMVNYELVIYQVYPVDGNPIFDGQLVIGFRKIPEAVKKDELMETTEGKK